MNRYLKKLLAEKILPGIVPVITAAVISLSASAEDRGSAVSGKCTLKRIHLSSSQSMDADHGPEMAFDENPETSWVSGKTGPQWIRADFETKRIMTSLRIRFGGDGVKNAAGYFILQFFHENAWFDFNKIDIARSFLFINMDRKTVDIDLGGVDASTFRLYFPEDSLKNGGASVSEIEIFAGTARIRYFDERLMGICLPVANALLPENDSSYPNSPRQYRGGWHSGLDIHCYRDPVLNATVPVSSSTPVRSIDSGTVLRADTEYRALTLAEWRKQSDYSRIVPTTFVKRSFGGMQVWIDHGNGVLSAYNHLSKIDPSVTRGKSVKKGQVIGWAGNSGSIEEAEGRARQGIHLHLEIWVDGFFLGYGMPVADVKKYFRWIFRNGKK
ncbi:MAG: peptidoglycan DD-metalloendopeptidase family protein [Spirochaetes bacterium]|jgi:murein DD-endopeptidase MepM/ murein hydrolase activator NlpD|nr:peptidoglycan DD-metalloendopeptidase family protein [Spirochaetota bacterium]